MKFKTIYVIVCLEKKNEKEKRQFSYDEMNFFFLSCQAFWILCIEMFSDFTFAFFSLQILVMTPLHVATGKSNLFFLISM